MAGETILTIVGNVVADPELRHTQAGLAVVNFRVATTPRTYDKDKSEWVDGEAMFLTCSCWREFAENVAASLSKGTRVIVQGRLVSKKFKDKDGNDRASIELEVEAVGPDLRLASAVVTRAGSATQASNQATRRGQAQQAPAEEKVYAPGQNAATEAGYREAAPERTGWVDDETPF